MGVLPSLASGHPCHDHRPRLAGDSLIDFSGRGGNAVAGVVVEVDDSGVQAQKFLRPFPPFESLLLGFWHLTLTDEEADIHGPVA